MSHFLDHQLHLGGVFAVDVPFSGPSAAFWGVFAVDVPFSGPSAAGLDTVNHFCGLGVLEATDTGNLIWIGTEAEADLLQEFFLFIWREFSESALLEKAAAKVREEEEDGLILECG